MDNQNINLGNNQMNQGGFGQRPYNANGGNGGNGGQNHGWPNQGSINNMGYSPDMGQTQPMGQNMNNMGGWQQNPNMNMGGPMNQPPHKPEFNVNLGDSPLAKVGQTGIKLVVYAVIAWLLMATQMTASIVILFCILD